MTVPSIAADRPPLMAERMNLFSDWLGARFLLDNHRLSPKHPFKVSLVLGVLAGLSAVLQLGYAAFQTESYFSFQHVRLAGAGPLFFGPLVVLPLAFWSGRSGRASLLAALASGGALWLGDVAFHSSTVFQRYLQLIVVELYPQPALMVLSIMIILFTPGFLIAGFAVGSFRRSRDWMAIGLCIIIFLLGNFWDGLLQDQAWMLTAGMAANWKKYWISTCLYALDFAFLPCGLAWAMGISLWETSPRGKLVMAPAR